MKSVVSAGGVYELDAEAVSRPCGGVGDRRVDQFRNGASDAQKNGFTAKKIEYWVIPPEADAEFVAGMEEILETYAEPVDSQVPVVCMDEQPVQLLAETRTPIPATRNHPKRIDYENERAGTASVFMFCEPKSGWRQVTARPRRTKVDGANEVNILRTHHVAIIAADYERSKDFYTRILGLKIVSEVFRTERNSYKLDLRLPDGVQIELFSFPNSPKCQRALKCHHLGAPENQPF